MTSARPHLSPNDAAPRVRARLHAHVAANFANFGHRGTRPTHARARVGSLRLLRFEALENRVVTTNIREHSRAATRVAMLSGLVAAAYCDGKMRLSLSSFAEKPAQSE